MIKNAPDVMTVKEVMKVLRCGRTKIMEFIHNGVLVYRITIIGESDLLRGKRRTAATVRNK